MMGQGWNRDNVRNFAEVFTPAPTVFEMVLLPEIRDALQDVDTPICDPCVGQGQFPAAELVLKMFYNIDRLDDKAALRALNSLFGIDIQLESVDECRAHMLATICDAFEFFTGRQFDKILFAASIIHHNFIQGDSLNDWANCLERLDLHYLAEKVRANHAKRKRDDRQLTLF